jgi:hypothetical protein
VDAETLDAYLTVLTKWRARGFTLTEHGFEVVLEPLPPKPAEKPADAPPPEGNMPTRAELDAEVERIRKGAKPK